MLRSLNNCKARACQRIGRAKPQGWQRADDTLPPRVLDEALPTGVASGTTLSRDELGGMITSYYEARGWTPEGQIPGVKLEELGLLSLTP